MTFKDNVERELIKMILRGHGLADNSKLDDADEINVFTALSKITKLVEGLIGEKDNTSLQATDDPSCSVFLQGKNKLREEIRQRLRG